MKVLIIGPFPPPINGNSFANKILHKGFMLKKPEQLQCKIIDTSTTPISSQQGSFSLKKAFKFVSTYFQIYKIFGSQVVYVTTGHTFFGVLKYAPFFLMAKMLNIPYVIHVHGNNLAQEYKNIRQFKRKIFHYLISNATTGIVLSKSLVDNLSNFLPFNRIFIVENFVEDELYEGKICGKNTDKPRIIYLSNLMREKGILEILDALVQLKAKGMDFQATIAGYIEVGLTVEIQEKLLQLQNNVEYVGIITGEKKKQKLLEANIIILPTYYKMEGQPICLLEGLATGNIIITTNHSGIPDIINESHGYFVKPKSPDAIADCIETINLNLTENIDRFSNSNILYATSNFTEEFFVDKIVAVLNKTLQYA